MKALRGRGFTLVELMFTIAIIGILASLAYPAYTSSLVKGSRASAKSFLMEVAQKEQGYLLDRRAYTTDLAALGATTPTEVSKYYTVAVTLTAGPPQGFAVRASPISGKRQYSDGWLELSNTGQKTSQYPDKW